MDTLDQWLDHDLGQSVQSISPLILRLTKIWKAAEKAQAVGDPVSFSNGLSQLRDVLQELPPKLDAALAAAALYDLKAYLDDLFDADFRKACTASGLTVEGQFPRYLVYPLWLQVDARRVGVLINRKLHKGLRVSRIMSEVRAERERLLGRPFNAKHFLADLEAAYDQLVDLESAKNRIQMAGHDVGLRHIYHRLVPMRQWRADYPEVFFALDLHRLLQSGELHALDGRRFHLAPAREASVNLTVLDSSGREVQLGLIAFRTD
jgi:hypothetical protein